MTAEHNLIYKHGVVINPGPLDPLIETLKMLSKVHGQIVITSGNDGKHAKNSYHYHDRAVDIRSRDRSNAELLCLLGDIEDIPIDGLKIRIELSSNKSEHFWWDGFNSLPENRGPNQHIHVEIRTVAEQVGR